MKMTKEKFNLLASKQVQAIDAAVEKLVELINRRPEHVTTDDAAKINGYLAAGVAAVKTAADNAVTPPAPPAPKAVFSL